MGGSGRLGREGASRVGVPGVGRRGGQQRSGGSRFGTTGALVAEPRARSGPLIVEFSGMFRVSATDGVPVGGLPGLLVLESHPEEALLALRRKIETRDS